MDFTRLPAYRALAVLACACAIFMSGPIGASRAQDSDPVVARVNGVDIHESDITFAEEEIGGNMPSIPPEQKRDYLINYLVDVVVLSQAAEKQKLDDRPNVKHRLAFDRIRLLMEMLLQDAGKSALSDAAEHQVYDDAVKQVKSEQEVHARHILVPTEDEAKAALARIKGGEDFAKVATELSKDPGSEGGDLGWFTKERMVPEFADAAFKLEPGQVSDPVKSQFGWHIIKVEEKRVKTFPTFEQVKDQAARYVVQKAQSELIAKLHEGATIERTEAEPKPAAPADAAKPADKPADAKAP